MGKVIKIEATANRGSQINEVNEIEAVSGIGLVSDRNFKNNIINLTLLLNVPMRIKS